MAVRRPRTALRTVRRQAKTRAEAAVRRQRPVPLDDQADGGKFAFARSEKISELVAHRIVQDIARRRLGTGDKLPPESAMLEIYRVSRASLREALRILEVNGLIAIRPGPGGGPVVRGAGSRDFGRMSALFFEMQQATIGELVDARLVVEPVMARLSAQRRDAVQMQRLKELLERARAAPLESEAAYASNITEFHEVVLHSSGNRILDLYGGAMKHMLTDRVVGRAFPPAAAERARAAHEAIGAAIMRGDAKAAERLMREHMEDFKENYQQRYPGLLDEVVSWRD